MKIGLERIDMQKGVIVEALLDSEATELVMSSKFTRKQEFILKKIEKPIYVRNVDNFFNKKGLIKHIVEVNIYYQRYRERTEINVIREQKQRAILGISQLACHNSEIDWRIEEVKIIRYPVECEKLKTKVKKLGQQKQKKKKKRKEGIKEKPKEKAKKGEVNRGQEDSRRIGNFG